MIQVNNQNYQKWDVTRMQAKDNVALTFSSFPSFSSFSSNFVRSCNNWSCLGFPLLFHCIILYLLVLSEQNTKRKCPWSVSSSYNKKAELEWLWFMHSWHLLLVSIWRLSWCQWKIVNCQGFMLRNMKADTHQTASICYS